MVQMILARRGPVFAESATEEGTASALGKLSVARSGLRGFIVWESSVFLIGIFIVIA
jgi:hypothetical protein